MLFSAAATCSLSPAASFCVALALSISSCALLSLVDRADSRFVMSLSRVVRDASRLVSSSRSAYTHAHTHTHTHTFALRLVVLLSAHAPTECVNGLLAW